MSSGADQTARRVVRLLEAFSSMQRAQTERLRRASEAVDRLEKVQAMRERGEAERGETERGGNGRTQGREHGQGQGEWEWRRGRVESEP